VTKVFETLNDVKQALQTKQIAALVTDTPTAQYISSSEIPGSVMVAQFPSTGEHYGLLFAKGGQLITGPAVDENLVRRQRNITLAPMKVLGLSRPEAVARATELLDRFGLAEKRSDYPDRLSGGQQQRVAIIRALAMRPRLMLLDEVTGALDPELVADVLDVIRELAQGGMTMVIATHEMGFARDIASRVCFLADGQIVEQAPPDQLFSQPSDERTRRFLRRIVDAGRM
jgi:polar amino acid transport system ATP-binding protein